MASAPIVAVAGLAGRQVAGSGNPATQQPANPKNTHAWLAYVAVIAAVAIMVGVYWDISWHMSIGRDSFWTPAHLLIQCG